MKVKKILTNVEILLKCRDSIPHFIVIKVRLDKGDLNIGFVRVQFVLFHNVGIFDDDHIFLSMFVTIELLEPVRDFRKFG